MIGLTAPALVANLLVAVAVPLGTWLGESWGWRGVYLLGVGAAALAVIAQAATLLVGGIASIAGGVVLVSLRQRR
jgi:predicted MFS family arabinose efflux permease